MELKINEVQLPEQITFNYEELKKEMEKYRSDFKPEEFFPYMFDEPYIHYYDSVSFVPDSLKSIYRLTPVERADTIYDRIEMIILKADTLEVTDSLPCLDSIDKKDTIIAGSVKKNVLNPIYGKK